MELNNINISPRIVYVNKDDAIRMSKHNKLSEEYMLKNKDILDWYTLSWYQTFSEKFYLDNIERMCGSAILERNDKVFKFSDDFIINNVLHKIDSDSLEYYLIHHPLSEKITSYLLNNITLVKGEITRMLNLKMFDESFFDKHFDYFYKMLGKDIYKYVPNNVLLNNINKHSLKYKLITKHKNKYKVPFINKLLGLYVKNINKEYFERKFKRHIKYGDVVLKDDYLICFCLSCNSHKAGDILNGDGLNILFRNNSSEYFDVLYYQKRDIMKVKVYYSDINDIFFDFGEMSRCDITARRITFL